MGTLPSGDPAAGDGAPSLGARCVQGRRLRPPRDRVPLTLPRLPKAPPPEGPAPGAAPAAHALISMYSGVSPANGSSVKSASYRRRLFACSSRSDGLCGFSRR